MIPTILALIVFSWSLRLYLRMYVAPKDSLEIKVTGQKWFWSFDYPNGTATVNELVVPAGKPIKLLMSSKDVIHGFYVPDSALKWMYCLIVIHQCGLMPLTLANTICSVHNIAVHRIHL